MRPVEHDAKSASTPTVGLIVVLVLAVVLLVPSVASAVFTRQFLCESHAAGSDPLGLTVDAANHAWVGGPGAEGGTLYELGAAKSECGVLIGPKPGPAPAPLAEGESPESLAVANGASLRIYAVGRQLNGESGLVKLFDDQGSPLAEWENLHEFESDGNNGAVAVDDSTDGLADPSACGTGSLAFEECFVYVAHNQADMPAPVGDGLPKGIEKFNSKGQPVAFAAAGSVSYVTGNEITASPGGSFGFSRPAAMAVDGEGDIFVVRALHEVDEFRPSGLFVRAFNVADGPDVGEGIGGVEGVALDRVSGNLLISVESSSEPSEAAIDEFSAATGAFVNQITATGESRLRGGGELAVDSLGDVYVTDRVTRAVDVFGPGVFLPTVRVEEAGDRSSHTAVVSGVVEREGLTLDTCEFQYVTARAFSEHGFSGAVGVGCVPGASEITSERQGVQAELTGLSSGMTYEYRLVAHSTGALGGTGVSGALEFTSPGAPGVEAEMVANVSSEFADLRAVIVPRGAETHYQFEIVSAERFGLNPAAPYEGGRSVPVPAGDVGEGGADGAAAEAVVSHVGGLLAGTVYHFRAVAENEVDGRVEVTDGPDRTFTTSAATSSGLPDGRAYELVTPAVKAGGGDMFAEAETNGEFFNKNTGSVSGSGDAFVFETFDAFGPFPSSFGSAYVFSRGASGWSFVSLANPALGVQSVGGVLQSADGSRVAFSDNIGSELKEGVALTSVVGPPGGPYTTLHVDPRRFQQDPANGLTTQVVGGSKDLGHVVLESGYSDLCGGAEHLQHGEVVCEWDGGTETVGGEVKAALSLVSARSGGRLLSTCGASLGSGASTGGAQGAVSSDGSGVVFTVPDPRASGEGGECWNGGLVHAPQVYLRRGGETIEVSSPRAGVSDPACTIRSEPACHAAEYAFASEDGERIFFISEGWLTADHPAVHDRELYEYYVPEQRLRRVSGGAPGAPAASAGAELEAVPAVAATGAAAYFLARGDLTGTVPPLGDPEKTYLYRYDAESRQTSYIATVNTLDYPKLCRRAMCSESEWYSTPDGRHLLFASTRELTGETTAGPCIHREGGSDGHCDAVYRYSQGEGLTCVSCSPTGASPVSNSLFNRSGTVAPTAGVVRAMSDDGSTVVFDTADALVPRDGNGTLDVYEWHDGRIGLISSGEDVAPSFFLGMSAYTTGTGERVEAGNVFFGTHSRLVPADSDPLGDIYDARICVSSSPCVGASRSSSPPCEGDACRAVPSAPVFVTPGSLTFAGAGNPVSSPAKKRPVKTTRSKRLAKTLAACSHRPRRRRAACRRKARAKFSVHRKAVSRVRKGGRR